MAIIFRKDDIKCPECGKSKHLEIIRVLTVTERYTKIPQGFAIASSTRNEGMSGVIRCTKCKIFVMSAETILKKEK